MIITCFKIIFCEVNKFMYHKVDFGAAKSYAQRKMPFCFSNNLMHKIYEVIVKDLFLNRAGHTGYHYFIW